jgi:hypothetical protein
VTLNFKTSITLKLGEEETRNPHVSSYETSLLTASSLAADEFFFRISAPSGTTSITRVYCGERGGPTSLWVNDVQQNETGSYDSVSKTLTLALKHNVEELDVKIKWNPRAGRAELIVVPIIITVITIIVTIAIIMRRQARNKDSLILCAEKVCESLLAQRGATW